MVTDATGEVFKGSKARTASSRNSHGSERNRSMRGGHDAFPASTQVTGHASDQAREQRGKQSGGWRQQQRDTGSIKQAGQPVPAQIIGAERKTRAKEER